MRAAVVTDFRFYDHGAASFTAASDGQVNMDRLAELTLDERDVGFFDDTVLDSHLEFTSDRRALGEDDEAARLAI